MKYVIRRAIASVVVAPVIATAYVLGYAVLVGLGATPSVNVSDAWNNGWLIAVAVGIVFTFWTQVESLAERR